MVKRTVLLNHIHHALCSASGGSRILLSGIRFLGQKIWWPFLVITLSPDFIFFAENLMTFFSCHTLRRGVVFFKKWPNSAPPYKNYLKKFTCLWGWGFVQTQRTPLDPPLSYQPWSWVATTFMFGIRDSANASRTWSHWWLTQTLYRSANIHMVTNPAKKITSCTLRMNLINSFFTVQFYDYFCNQNCTIIPNENQLLSNLGS